MRRAARSVWSVVHAERIALVHDLEPLTPEQWETPSWCEGWSVHDVLAHLVDNAKATRMGFVRRLAAHRFDFNYDNEAGVILERAPEPAQTLDRMRAVADRTTTPPVPLATRLVEAFVHGEDIRQPLGIQRDYPPAHVATALEYQVRTTSRFGGGKEQAAGLRLVAPDAGYEHGTGPVVEGRAIDLLAAVSGRREAAVRLSGPGVPVLVGR